MLLLGEGVVGVGERGGCTSRVLRRGEGERAAVGNTSTFKRELKLPARERCSRRTGCVVPSYVLNCSLLEAS